MDSIIDTKNKVGLVLPGGGVLAFESQMGMLLAMREEGFEFDFIYTCSGGGLSGMLWNSGKDIVETITDIDIDKVLVRNKNVLSCLFGKPLYKTEGIEKKFYEIMGDRVFKNMIVNMTDVKTRETYYAFATRSTIIASMSIPRVFPVKLLSGTVFKNSTPYSYDGPMSSKYEEFLLNNTPVYDGGIYNLFPFPDIKDILRCKKLYCLCCPHTLTVEQMNTDNSIKDAIFWIYETMERGFRQSLSAYGGLENVRIFRPEPCDGSLLNLSKDLEIFYKGYDFMKKMIKENKI